MMFIHWSLASFSILLTWRIAANASPSLSLLVSCRILISRPQSRLAMSGLPEPDAVDRPEPLQTFAWSDGLVVRIVGLLVLEAHRRRDRIHQRHVALAHQALDLELAESELVELALAGDIDAAQFIQGIFHHWQPR